MASRVFIQSAAALRPTAGFAASRSSTLMRRSIATTPRLLNAGHKESANPDAEVSDLDKHKQDLLRKQKDGKGHWKPELASDSEEAVKADRSSSGEDLKTLQERTKKAAEETSKAGTSMRDGL